MIKFGSTTVGEVVDILSTYDRPWYKVLVSFYKDKSPNGMVLARTYIIKSERDLLSWPEFGPSIIKWMRKDGILT